MFYHEKKLCGDKRKSALLESEQLRQDIQDLEDALILHTRYQSDSDSSVRGMIRKEIGVSHWEHGGEGKLTTYKSGRDLGQHRTKKHDLVCKKITDGKKQQTISDIADQQWTLSDSASPELDRPLRDKGNLDDVTASATHKQSSKKAKSSASKRAPKDVTPDRENTSQLEIISVKTAGKSTQPDGIVDPRDRSQDTKRKRADLKNKSLSDRQQRSHRKKIHKIGSMNCEEIDINDSKSHNTVLHPFKIADIDILKAEVLAKASTKVFYRKQFSSSNVKEAVKKSSCLNTTQISRINTNNSLIKSKLNAQDQELNESSDHIKLSLMETSNAANKSRIIKTKHKSADRLHHEYQGLNPKNTTAKLHHELFNDRGNETGSKTKDVLSNQNQIVEKRDKCSMISEGKLCVDCDNNKTDWGNSFDSHSHDDKSIDSKTLKKPQCQSVPTELVCLSTGESILNNERVQFQENMNVKDYPHIFNPIRTSFSMITITSAQASNLATDKNDSSYPKSSKTTALINQNIDDGQTSDMDSTQPSCSFSPTFVSKTPLSSLFITPILTSEVGQATSSKLSVLDSHLLTNGTDLHQQLHINKSQQQPHYVVIPTSSQRHSLSSTDRDAAVKPSNDIDPAYMNRTKTACNIEMETWLKDLGLQSVDHFVKIFNDHQMDMAKVRLLTASDLREMGIHDLGPIMRIMKGVHVLRRNEVPLQQGDKSSIENRAAEHVKYAVVNKSYTTNTYNLAVSSTKSHLELMNESENINVNGKDFEEDDTSLCKTALFSAMPEQSLIPACTDFNNRSKSDLIVSNQDTSDHPNKTLVDMLSLEVLKNCTKPKHAVHKKPATGLVNGQMSRSSASGRPSTCIRAADDGICVTDQKFDQKHQKLHSKVEVDIKVKARQKQMREEMAARHVQRRQSSNLDRDARRDEKSEPQATASASFISDTLDKLQVSEWNNKTTEKHRQDKDGLDLALATVTTFPKHHPIQQKMEKQQQQLCSEQKERLKQPRHVNSVNLAEQVNLHSEGEPSPDLPARIKGSARERRRQKADIGNKFVQEQKGLASSPLLSIVHRNNSCLRLNSGQVNLEPRHQLPYQAGDNIGQRESDGLLVNITVDNGKNYSEVTGNSCSAPEETSATKSTKNIAPTTAFIRPKGLQLASLRNNEVSHMKRLPKKHCQRFLRADLGHNKIMDRIKKVELNRSEINFLEKDLLGSGAFSEVFKGTYQGSEVAVKRLRAPLHTRDFNYFVAEVSMLQELRHPHVVMMLGVCSSSDKLPLIVMEFLACGNLESWLQDTKRPSLNHKEFYQITHDVAAGMLYLHHRNPPVLHLDLKPKNILIGHEARAKVADFGFTDLKRDIDMNLYQSNKSHFIQGKPAWMAPEMFSTGEITFKSDVYSFGMVLWEMLTRQIPYEDLSVFQILEQVRTNRRPTIPANCPSGLSHLVQRCWDQNPAARPRFKEVLGCLERLSERSEYRTPKDAITGQVDQIASLILTQNDSSFREHRIKEGPLKCNEGRVYRSTQIDLISLSSEDEKDNNSDNDTEVEISEFSQDSAKDFIAFTGVQTLDFVNDIAYTVAADKSKFVSQFCLTSSRNNLNSPENADESKGKKGNTTLELSESYLPSRKLNFFVSKSQDIMKINPSEKLLSLRQSLDRPKASFLQENSLRPQGFGNVLAEKHSGRDLVDGTVLGKMCRSVAISDDYKDNFSFVDSQRPTKGSKDVDVVKKSSSDLYLPIEDAQFSYSVMEPYVPSFHKMLSPHRFRNKNVKSRLSRRSSLEGSRSVLSSSQVTGSLSCTSADMHSGNSSIHFLNKTNVDSGLDFSKSLYTSNEDSNKTPGELVTDCIGSLDICVIAENTKSNLPRIEHNTLSVESSIPLVFIDANKSKQIEDTKSQLQENNVQDLKEKPLGIETDSLQTFTERLRHSVNAESDSCEFIGRDSTNAKDVVNDFKQQSPHECGTEFSTACCVQELAVVRKYSPASLKHEPAASVEESHRSKHIFVNSSTNRCHLTFVNNMADTSNSQTLPSGPSKASGLHQADDYCPTPAKDSIAMDNELQTLAQESDSESSVIPDNISEDSLSKDVHTSCAMSVDRSLRSSGCDQSAQNALEEIVPTTDKLVSDCVLIMASGHKKDSSTCDNTTKSLFLSDVANNKLQLFQVGYISHYKINPAVQIHCDLAKIEPKDISFIPELPTESNNSAASKYKIVSSACCGHQDKTLQSEASIVPASKSSELMSHVKTLHQELLYQSGQASGGITSKIDLTVEGTVQKHVTEPVSRKTLYPPGTPSLLPNSHKQSEDRPTTFKLKTEAQTSHTTCLFAHDKKLLKTRGPLPLHNKQMLKSFENHSHFSVEASMLAAQKRLLKPIATSETSPLPVIAMKDREEGCPTVISILKKAMTDRRFAIGDAQESQDVSSDTSWSIQD